VELLNCAIMSCIDSLNIMSWFVPTSPTLGLSAQHALLTHFVKTPFEVKSTSNLNYVEFRSARESTGSDERVLILMHGYGSGLGFFFGKLAAI
jgi:hypothetical protein